MHVRPTPTANQVLELALDLACVDDAGVSQDGVDQELTQAALFTSKRPAYPSSDPGLAGPFQDLGRHNIGERAPHDDLGFLRSRSPIHRQLEAEFHEWPVEIWMSYFQRVGGRPESNASTQRVDLMRRAVGE
jgi:hypothetical protein